MHVNIFYGEQGWRSGESTRQPPMWPWFDSQTRRHMWVEFIVGSRTCSEGFLRILQFPPSAKTIFEIPIRSGISGPIATLWMCHCKFLFIILYIYLYF